jgi:hypothetical protein
MKASKSDIRQCLEIQRLESTVNNKKKEKDESTFNISNGVNPPMKPITDHHVTKWNSA